MRSQKLTSKKDAKNEAEYEEYSVIDEGTRYFNIFKCGVNILNRLDVAYERACVATTKKGNYCCPQ